MKSLQEGRTAAVAGQVVLLRRYPVKSMDGEELDRCMVVEAGLRGDRVRVLVRDGSERQVTAREVPGLLHYTAAWTENGEGTDLGLVEIRTPGGRVLPWTDDSLFGELEALAGEPLAWMVFGAEDPLTGVDDAPLLLVTEASLRELGRLWQDEPGLWRRFRPNVVLRMEEGKPFEELDWIGRRFMLGEAELVIVKGCERCTMITLHPHTLEKDPSLQKLVNESFKGIFGVYARVVRQGPVRKGDPFRAV